MIVRAEGEGPGMGVPEASNQRILDVRAVSSCPDVCYGEGKTKRSPDRRTRVCEAERCGNRRNICAKPATPEGSEEGSRLVAAISTESAEAKLRRPPEKQRILDTSPAAHVVLNTRKIVAAGEVGESPNREGRQAQTCSIPRWRVAITNLKGPGLAPKAAPPRPPKPSAPSA
jgi:hypothetical protein